MTLLAVSQIDEFVGTKNFQIKKATAPEKEKLDRAKRRICLVFGIKCMIKGTDD